MNSISEHLSAAHHSRYICLPPDRSKIQRLDSPLLYFPLIAIIILFGNSLSYFK